MKVLYLMGHGWSGSTLLGGVLGEIEGFFHAGELRTLWDDGLMGSAVCGCGQPVRGCELWSEVAARTLGGAPAADVARWHRGATRVRDTIRLLRLAPGKPSGRRSVDAYVEVASRLYASLADMTGCRVIVDSSKRAGDAAFLRLVPGVRPYYVHLIRDPRAVAQSWRKRGVPGHGPAATARDWVAFNVLDEVIAARVGGRRAIRVRYEDFVERPRETVRAIASLMDEGDRELPIEGGRTVRLGPNHTALGNPVRFRTGPVELRNDEEWRTVLPARDRRTVSALTFPLLLRYGYPARIPGPRMR